MEALAHKGLQQQQQEEEEREAAREEKEPSSPKSIAMSAASTASFGSSHDYNNFPTSRNPSQCSSSEQQEKEMDHARKSPRGNNNNNNKEKKRFREEESIVVVDEEGKISSSCCHPMTDSSRLGKRIKLTNLPAPAPRSAFSEFAASFHNATSAKANNINNSMPPHHQSFSMFPSSFPFLMATPPSIPVRQQPQPQLSTFMAAAAAAMATSSYPVQQQQQQSPFMMNNNSNMMMMMMMPLPNAQRENSFPSSLIWPSINNNL